MENIETNIETNINEQGVDTQTTENNEGEKTSFTKEEVDKMMANMVSQEKVNEIINKTVAKERSKREEEIAEQKRLAQLTAEEREKEVAKKTQEELEQTRRELRMLKLEQDTVARLSEENLPLSFSNIVISEDEEKTNENIKTLKNEFDLAVEKAVEERFKRSSPKVTASNFKPKQVGDIKKIAEQARIVK